jgi:hypothetical protein
MLKAADESAVGTRTHATQWHGVQEAQQATVRVVDAEGWCLTSSLRTRNDYDYLTTAGGAAAASADHD